MVGAVGVLFGVLRWHQGRALNARVGRMERLLERMAAERTEDTAAALLVTDEVHRSDIRPEDLGEQVARLPEREKLVVTLYYYEDLSLDEIAEVLGVTPDRVTMILRQALRRLSLSE